MHVKTINEKQGHDFKSSNICMGLQSSKGKGKWYNYNFKNIKQEINK